MGMFDDLIPAAPRGAAAGPAISFDDLIPAQSPERSANGLKRVYITPPAADPPPEPVTVNDVGRSFASGVPIVGGVLNKLNAATNAALAPALNPLFDEKDQLSEATFPERYAHSLRDQEGADSRFSKDHPIVDTAAHIAGGVASMGPVMMAAPKAFGLAGETVLGRMGAGAASGAAVGGADAAARGENVATGAGTGFAVGALAPPIARGLGSVVKAVRSSGPEIAGSASSRIARALRDDGLDAGAVERRLAELGPEATLADLGPNLRGQAEAIAAAPGAGQKTVVDAMTARSGRAGERITGALDQHLGGPVNPTELAETIIGRRKAAAAPLYQEAYATPIKTTPDINAVLDTPFGKLALQKAATLAKNEVDVPLGMFGPKPTGPLSAKMTAAEFQQYLKSGASTERPVDVRGMDLVKRALDDMHDQAQRGGANNRARVIDGLRKTLTKAVDGQAPKFAAARDVFSTESGIKDALENGRALFSKSMSPDELGGVLRGMSGAEYEAFTQGARSAVADIMGSARNDASAARGLFAKGWTREKLDAVLGPHATEALFTELEREGLFHQTATGILSNSRTAARTAAGKEFPNAVDAPKMSHGTTALDAALYLPRKAVSAVAGGVMRDRAAKVGSDAASALMATAESRSEVVQKLWQRQLQNAKNDAQRAQIERIIQAGGRSLVPNVGR